MRSRTARKLRRPDRLHRRIDSTKAPDHPLRPEQRNVTLDCGWGRLLFGQTFSSDPAELVDELLREQSDRRDMAMYVSDPHVIVSYAPQDIFLDPSHTFRLELTRLRPQERPPDNIQIRRIQSRDDVDAVNRLYGQHHMKQADADFLVDNLRDRRRVVLVALNPDGRIIGTVTGIDHVETFNDPEQGSSLWCLAVDIHHALPGTGEALVRNLAGRFLGRGRAWMDLSVMHDNKQAIALYDKLGFHRVNVFCLKRKNTFNRGLFVGRESHDNLNPYAQIIVDEALARGIRVQILDAAGGYFKLAHGGRSIRCRESLTDLTSAVVMSRCADKALCARMLRKTDVRVPAQMFAAAAEDNREFLQRFQRIVVKPVDGEQGAGVSVDIRDEDSMQAAIESAQAHGRVLLEEYIQGKDLRIIVIDYQVVAAAIREPAAIVGDGRNTVENLILKQSRRRAAATQGESRIPMDGETIRCVEAEGHRMDEVLRSGSRLQVRKTANLHTGGILVDVTEQLHPALRKAAETTARTLEIPVTGLDFMVKSATTPDYAFIEANERPGLANHEPQPTAQRFIDLLFPETAS
nr:N-acetylglutaminylglutamine synthetase [Oceanococcus sp. HetDA_MAG_MS8]